MPTNFLWGTVPSPLTLLGSELDSLAVDTQTSLGAEVDNSANYQMGTLQLELGSAAFVDGNYMKVYFIPADDHATSGAYPTAYDDESLTNYLAGVIYIQGSTAAQRESLPYVLMPPGFFKTIAITSGSCPTLNAAGNDLVIYPTPTQY